MAQSTTNLLTAVNRVLRDVGEVRVTSLTSATARKAADYLQEAVIFLAASHDWEWLHNKVLATNWVGDSFQVPTAQQVRGVAWQLDTGAYHDLTYLDVRTFDLRTSNGFGLGSTVPLYYTLPSYQLIRVNPYPTTLSGQNRLFAYIIEDLQFPVVESALFPIPEKYMSLVFAKANYFMSMRHAVDSNSAQFFDKDFNELLMRYRSQENKTPTGGFNMYRSRIRRYGVGLY